MNRWNAFLAVSGAFALILFVGACAAGRSYKRDWNQCEREKARWVGLYLDKP